MEKKKHTGLIIFVTLIAGLLIGVGGSYFYFSNLTTTKSTKKEVNGDNQKTEKTENLDVYDKTIQDNLNKLTGTIGTCEDIYKYFLKSTKVTPTDIENKIAYALIDANFMMQKTAISASEYEKKAKEYFGEDYKFEHKDYTKELCTSHKYNPSTNNYEPVETACGCTSGPNAFILHRVSKAERTKDLLKINVKVLFPGDYNDLDSLGHVKYYSDANKTKAIPDLSYDTSSDIPNEDSQLYDNDDAYTKGGTYLFTMKKNENNTYSFVSSEPVE